MTKITAEEYVLVPYDITISLGKRTITIPKNSRLVTNSIESSDEDGNPKFEFTITYGKTTIPIDIYSSKDEAIKDGWVFEVSTEVPSEAIDDAMLDTESTLISDELLQSLEAYGWNIKPGQAYYSLWMGILKMSLRLSVISKSNARIEISLADATSISLMLREPTIQFLVNLGYVLSESTNVKPNKKRSNSL